MVIDVYYIVIENLDNKINKKIIKIIAIPLPRDDLINTTMYSLLIFSLCKHIFEHYM